MERSPEDLTGLTQDQAREYIAAHLTSLKLTEKKVSELDAEIAKWRGRAELARSKGAEDLAQAAEAEAARLGEDRARIGGEAEELRLQIEGMRHQLGALPAKERSIDPDLLEQELIIAAGGTPGEENTLRTERAIAELEKENAAEEALAALKERLQRDQGAR